MKQFCFLFSLLLATCQFSFAQVIFHSGGDGLFSIEITEDLTFAATASTPGETGVALVFNNVFSSPTYLEDNTWILDSPFSGQIEASWNELGSDFSMPWILRSSGPTPPAELDLDAQDLLLVLYWEPYPTITEGDTFVIHSGTSITPNGLGIPFPDQLGDTVSVHLASSMYPTILSDYQELSVSSAAIPEAGYALPIGLIAIAFVFVRRIRRNPAI